MLRKIKARIRGKGQKEGFDSLNLLKNQEYQEPERRVKSISPKKSKSAIRSAFKLGSQRCSLCDTENPKFFCPCGKDFYCSKECQTEDWPRHIKVCESI